MKQGKKHKINKFSTSFSTTNKRKIVKKLFFMKKKRIMKKNVGIRRDYKVQNYQTFIRLLFFTLKLWHKKFISLLFNLEMREIIVKLWNFRSKRNHFEPQPEFALLKIPWNSNPHQFPQIPLQNSHFIKEKLLNVS